MSIKKAVFNACYAHIVDNNGIPYILVATQFMPTTELLPFAKPDGSIVLNIAMISVQHLTINDDDITFSMTFRGQVVHTKIPYSAMFSIYDAKDATVGMLISHAFPTVVEISPEPTPPKPVEPVRKKPALSLVKK